VTLHFSKGLSDRRTFLKRLGAAGALTIIGTNPVRPMKAWALPGLGQDSVLVSVFLRGGADGLDLVPPYADDNYYTLRPDLGVPAGRYIDLDGFFGLNEALRPLYGHFQDQRLAIVHAAGSISETYSHFAAQPNMDTAFSTTGWLQRTLQAGQFSQTTSGLSIGSRVSPPLQGPWAGSVVNTINETTQNGMSLEIARTAIEEMYAITRFPLDSSTVASALLSVDEISGVQPGDPGAYPSSGLSTDFREAAAIIKADIGVRGVAIDYGGWDTHSNQTTRINNLASTLSAAIDAFHTDLGFAAGRVVVLVMTEFGRTARQNGSGGTDHGHGNFMFAFGNALQGTGGGQVHLNGEWPGLAPGVGGQLHIDRDLTITTDFRSVLAEVIDRHLGINPGAVFSGFDPTYVNLLADPGPSGDTNNSGTVDGGDVRMMVNDFVGNPNAGYSPRAGDMDQDGVTDLRDALMLARQVAGLDAG